MGTDLEGGRGGVITACAGIAILLLSLLAPVMVRLAPTINPCIIDRNTNWSNELGMALVGVVLIIAGLGGRMTWTRERRQQGAAATNNQDNRA